VGPFRRWRNRGENEPYRQRRFDLFSRYGEGTRKKSRRKGTTEENPDPITLGRWLIPSTRKKGSDSSVRGEPNPVHPVKKEGESGKKEKLSDLKGAKSAITPTLTRLGILVNVKKKHCPKTSKHSTITFRPEGELPRTKRTSQQKNAASIHLSNKHERTVSY